MKFKSILRSFQREVYEKEGMYILICLHGWKTKHITNHYPYCGLSNNVIIDVMERFEEIFNVLLYEILQ